MQVVMMQRMCSSTSRVFVLTVKLHAFAASSIAIHPPRHRPAGSSCGPTGGALDGLELLERTKGTARKPRIDMSQFAATNWSHERLRTFWGAFRKGTPSCFAETRFHTVWKQSSATPHKENSGTWWGTGSHLVQSERGRKTSALSLSSGPKARSSKISLILGRNGFRPGWASERNRGGGRNPEGRKDPQSRAGGVYCNIWRANVDRSALEIHGQFEVLLFFAGRQNKRTDTTRPPIYLPIGEIRCLFENSETETALFALRPSLL